MSKEWLQPLFEAEERGLRTVFFFRLRLVAMRPDGGFVRKYFAGAEKDPPGKAAGYDFSQRVCEPSDISRDFFDSLLRRTGRILFCESFERTYK